MTYKGMLDIFGEGSFSVEEDVGGDVFSLFMRGWVIGVKDDLLDISWELYPYRKSAIDDADCRRCKFCMFKYCDSFPEKDAEGKLRMPTVLFCKFYGNVMSFDFMRIRESVGRGCKRFELDYDAGWHDR
jgi:hypothetical protein